MHYLINDKNNISGMSETSATIRTIFSAEKYFEILFRFRFDNKNGT